MKNKQKKVKGNFFRRKLPLWISISTIALGVSLFAIIYPIVRIQKENQNLEISALKKRYLSEIKSLLPKRDDKVHRYVKYERMYDKYQEIEEDIKESKDIKSLKSNYPKNKSEYLERIKEYEDSSHYFKIAPGSSIKNPGSNSAIFEDSQGNIYVQNTGGKNDHFEVLYEGEKDFVQPKGISTNRLFFFEDSQGNVYFNVSEKGLVFKPKNKKKFIEAPLKTNNLGMWKLFEDSQGNIYAMGEETKLQVKNKDTNEFVYVPGSTINDGANGTIFEDSQGNIYVMGSGSNLEVLYEGKKKNLLKRPEVP